MNRGTHKKEKLLNSHVPTIVKLKRWFSGLVLHTCDLPSHVTRKRDPTKWERKTESFETMQMNISCTAPFQMNDRTNEASNI